MGVLRQADLSNLELLFTIPISSDTKIFKGEIMAGGWTRDGAIQDQIDDTISDAVKHARGQLPKGESAKFCVECGDEIPERRRSAVPGVKTCVPCQSERDGNHAAEIFNRRGSKDSQLR